MDQIKLKALLSYDENSGIFWWKETRNNFVKEGSIAGSLVKSREMKYIAIKIDGISYKAHRLAWLYVFGSLPEFEIDHIDGNGLNNKISNLRDVRQSENQKNKKRYENNKSGVSGVHFSNKRGKWIARISANGKRIALGSYLNKADAIKARLSAERKYKFHKNHGKR